MHGSLSPPRRLHGGSSCSSDPHPRPAPKTLTPPSSAYRQGLTVKLLAHQNVPSFEMVFIRSIVVAIIAGARPPLQFATILVHLCSFRVHRVTHVTDVQALECTAAG